MVPWTGRSQLPRPRPPWSLAVGWTLSAWSQASKTSHDEIKEAVQDLTHFCFDEFCSSSGTVDDMIEQIPSYMVKVQSTTSKFWKNVAGAEKHNAKLAKKAADGPEKYGSATWKTDPIEQARCVWWWWRETHNYQGIHFFSIAARLVVLVQVSSASVERIFSQMKLICETTGNIPLEETVLACVFQQCNDYLTQD